MGPDSNQIFQEHDIPLEADYFRVIGSYNSYRYGSVNMTLLGSTSQAVTWASLISSGSKCNPSHRPPSIN